MILCVFPSVYTLYESCLVGMGKVKDQLVWYTYLLFFLLQVCFQRASYARLTIVPSALAATRFVTSYTPLGLVIDR